MRNLTFGNQTNQPKIYDKIYPAISNNIGSGCILSTDGTKIYYSLTISGNIATMVIEDLQNNTLMPFQQEVIGISGTYQGIIKAPNNRIFFIPSTAQYLAYYDEITKRISIFGDPVPGIGQKYVGGCLAQDGKIYFFGYQCQHVLEIDYVNLTYITYLNVLIPEGATTALLGADGYVYLNNANYVSCQRFDIVSKTVVATLGPGTYLSSFPINFAGTLTANNKIITSPYFGTQYRLIDYQTGNFQYFDILGPYITAPWVSGAALGLDKWVYFIPLNRSSVVRMNPETFQIQELTPIRTFQSTSQSVGSCIDSQGVIHTAYFGVSDNVNTKRLMKIATIGDESDDFWKIPTDLSTLPSSRYNLYNNRTI
jgi:hypothetical protein